jgi:uncharacterized membrane protein
VVIIYQQQAKKSSTFAAKMKKWLSLTNGIRKEAVQFLLLMRSVVCSKAAFHVRKRTFHAPVGAFHVAKPLIFTI